MFNVQVPLNWILITLLMYYFLKFFFLNQKWTQYRPEVYEGFITDLITDHRAIVNLRGTQSFLSAL